jgi:hypothetical protein
VGIKMTNKKKPNMSNNAILLLFDAKDRFKNDDMQQKTLLQDHILLVVKNHLPIQFVENTWLKHLAMHLCPRCFLQELLFPNSCCQIWCRGQNKNVFCKGLHNVILPHQILTYECQREHM